MSKSRYFDLTSVKNTYGGKSYKEHIEDVISELGDGSPDEETADDLMMKLGYLNVFEDEDRVEYEKGTRRIIIESACANEDFNYSSLCKTADHLACWMSDAEYEIVRKKAMEKEWR